MRKIVIGVSLIVILLSIVIVYLVVSLNKQKSTSSETSITPSPSIVQQVSPINAQKESDIFLKEEMKKKAFKTKEFETQKGETINVSYPDNMATPDASIIKDLFK